MPYPPGHPNREPVWSKLLWLIVVVGFALYFFMSDARSESEIQLRLGVSHSAPRISSSTENDSKKGIAAGLSFAVEFSPSTYLETGFHIRGHKYAETSTTEISYTDMVVPVLARYRLLPWLDLGAGLYYAQNPDSFKRKTATSTVQTVRFDSAGLEGAEWGVRFNPRFYFGVRKNWFIDIAYDHGMKDLDTGGGVVWKNRVYSVALGLALRVGGTPGGSDSSVPEKKAERPKNESTPKQKSKPQFVEPEYEESAPI